MRKSRILITCPKGIPLFLRQELIALGFPVLSEHVAGVETEGSLDDALRLNLPYRTGHRVLFLLKEFKARIADDLYRRVTEIAWEAYIPQDGYVCVTSSVENPSIRDSRFATLRCKDAIVDRIKNATGTRPDSGSDRGRSVVHLYWKDDRGDRVSRHLGRAAFSAGLPQDPARRSHAGNACRRCCARNRLGRQRYFHQPHVRQRYACHRSGPHRSRQGAGAFARATSVSCICGNMTMLSGTSCVKRQKRDPGRFSRAGSSQRISIPPQSKRRERTQPRRESSTSSNSASAISRTRRCRRAEESSS